MPIVLTTSAATAGLGSGQVERVLQGTPTTITNSWYSDGTITDPGTVAVDITRWDGTTVTTNASTTGSGANARTLNLNTTQTALLDRLTVTWKTSLLGNVITYVEVVGGFLFALNQLSDQLGSAETSETFTSDDFVKARTYAETSLEDACGVAFVPRYARETVSGNDRTGLQLTWPRVRTIRDVLVGGTAVTGTFASDAGGRLYYPTYNTRWTAGISNVVTGYEHGYDYPPVRGVQAAIALAKSFLTEGPIDDRATSMSTDVGVFSLSTPGLRGASFGIPAVDSFVQDYSERPLFA